MSVVLRLSTEKIETGYIIYDILYIGKVLFRIAIKWIVKWRGIIERPQYFYFKSNTTTFLDH